MQPVHCAAAAAAAAFAAAACNQTIGLRALLLAPFAAGGGHEALVEPLLIAVAARNSGQWQHDEAQQLCVAQYHLGPGVPPAVTRTEYGARHWVRGCAATAAARRGRAESVAEGGV